MLKLVAIALTAFVALSHFGFLVLEIFFWDHDIGRKVFNMSPEQSKMTAPLAMQQGLYNGFLAAGLVWGLLAAKRDVIIFFLICVVVAGIFAALTVKPSIFFSQATPAILALAFTLMGPRRAG